jgi:hypothetical protein
LANGNGLFLPCVRSRQSQLSCCRKMRRFCDLSPLCARESRVGNDPGDIALPRRCLTLAGSLTIGPRNSRPTSSVARRWTRGECEEFQPCRGVAN